MTNATEQNPGAAGAESGAPAEIRNLPAVIADAPAPPIPADRMKGQPEDAFERFAFALWNSGRKDEALELIERQIARERAERTAAATTPPFWTTGRPLIAGAAALVIVGVLWTGFGRMDSLPQWLSFETAREVAAQRLQAEPQVMASAGDAPAMTGALPEGPDSTGLAAAEDDLVPLPDEEAASLEQAAARAAEDEPESEAAAAVDEETEPTTVAAAQEPAPDAVDEPLPEATRESRQAEQPAERREDGASAGISDMARAAGVGAIRHPAVPQTQSVEPRSAAAALPPAPDASASHVGASDASAPVTLRSLADRGAPPPEDEALLATATLTDLAAPRLPRVRPEPSGALVARLNAPEPVAPPRTAVAARDRDRDVEPYVVSPPPPFRSERQAEPQPRRGLRIIGRVDEVPPHLAYRRAQAERYMTHRRALAERYGSRGWDDEGPWPPAEGYPYAYGSAPYGPQPRMPWIRRVPGGYVIGGY